MGATNGLEIAEEAFVKAGCLNAVLVGFEMAALFVALVVVAAVAE